MIRAGLAAFALVALLAAPAGSQPVDSAKLDRAAAESGRRTEQFGAAINIATQSFDEMNQRVQRLAGTGLTGPKAAAEAPALRRLVAHNLENVKRSNAMLASLPPFPRGLQTDISGEQMVADARAQNGRLIELLGHYDAVFSAMASGDQEALKRALPGMMAGAFTLIGQQRLLFRNRQASVPASNSTHQALGIAVQIYRTMEAVARRGLAATGTGAESAKTVAALGDEMRSIARDSRALTAAGRRNLARELADLESARKSASRDADAARLTERARGAVALEEKSFEIGDRLASYAETQAAMTVEQLRQTKVSSLLAAVNALESDYMNVAMEQAALVGQGPN